MASGHLNTELTLRSGVVRDLLIGTDGTLAIDLKGEASLQGVTTNRGTVNAYKGWWSLPDLYFGTESEGAAFNNEGTFNSEEGYGIRFR
jgi:hypothetical protein